MMMSFTRMKRIVGGMLGVLFVGAIGGWAYLASVAIGQVEAQVTSYCRQGAQCNVNTLNATTVSATTITGSTAVRVPENTGYICIDSPTCTYRILRNGSAGRTEIRSGQTWFFDGNVTYYDLVAKSINLSATPSGQSALGLTSGAQLNLGSGADDYISAPNGHSGTAGGFQYNLNSAAKPACNSTNRGTIWYVAGGAAQADTFEVCVKDAVDAYAWTALY